MPGIDLAASCMGFGGRQLGVDVRGFPGVGRLHTSGVPGRGATTVNQAYLRRPEAAELTMVIGWCMGVGLETITGQGWQKRPIKIRNEKRIKRI